MEDDSFQYAARVLRHANRHHGSLLPRSDRRVRVLYLGLVSNRVQALPFYTSLSIVRVLGL